MFKDISAVLIWSEDYRSLADWYEEKLALKPFSQLDHPKDTGVLYKIGTTSLWIGRHSEVHGKNTDMHRHMFNLVVDSVTDVYQSLQKKGVTFFAPPFKAPTMDKYFATFYDLDNNLVQLVGGK